MQQFNYSCCYIWRGPCINRITRIKSSRFQLLLILRIAMTLSERDSSFCNHPLSHVHLQSAQNYHNSELKMKLQKLTRCYVNARKSSLVQAETKYWRCPLVPQCQKCWHRVNTNNRALSCVHALYNKLEIYRTHKDDWFSEFCDQQTNSGIPISVR